MSEIRLFKIHELGAFAMSTCGERAHVVLNVVLHLHFTSYTRKDTTDLDDKSERWIKHRYIPAPVEKLFRRAEMEMRQKEREAVVEETGMQNDRRGPAGGRCRDPWGISSCCTCITCIIYMESLPWFRHNSR